MLATAPDAQVRDGKRAVEFATRACALAGWDQPVFLETLAAAYAESGEFQSAVEWQTKAMAVESDDLEGQQERLERYRNEKAYRQKAKSNSQK